jgi:hypothetical protein
MKTTAATTMWISRGISRHGLEVHPIRPKVAQIRSVDANDWIPSEEALTLYARKHPEAHSASSA